MVLSNASQLVLSPEVGITITMQNSPYCRGSRLRVFNKDRSHSSCAQGASNGQVASAPCNILEARRKAVASQDGQSGIERSASVRFGSAASRRRRHTTSVNDVCAVTQSGRRALHMLVLAVEEVNTSKLQANRAR